MLKIPEYSVKELRTIFVDGGYISDENFKLAEKSKSPIRELLRLKILTPDLIGQAIAEHLSTSYADINSNGVYPNWTKKFDESFARTHRTVLYKVQSQKKIAILATDSPQNRAKIVAAAKILLPGYTFEVAYALSDDIDDALKVFEKPLQERLAEILKGEGKKVSSSLNEIFEEALVRNVSDIHFEPKQNNVHLRFRVDGILAPVGEVSREYYQSIVNRIKVLAGLRIDEHLKTQDGSIRLNDEHGREVDLRVSIAPTIVGEKVVIRILSKYAERTGLEDLGFTEQQAGEIKAASEQPLGLVIIAGPTGSGKTTTLHTVLSDVATPQVNITTIEDPVEYRLAEANQIQVNEEQGITFAKGLRSIVRQDPDVILVGEIRDAETAEISVNAALTGHRVLSTFHASSASITIPRLLDMGVEEFLLSSTLSVVVGQRLIRTLCTECRYSYTPTKADLQALVPKPERFFKAKETLYKAKGCEVCGGIGYRGRTSVAEVLPVTSEIRKHILSRSDAATIEQARIAEGGQTMFEAGVEKIRRGETSLEELLRVVTPPEA